MPDLNKSVPAATSAGRKRSLSPSLRSKPGKSNVAATKRRSRSRSREVSRRTGGVTQKNALKRRATSESSKSSSSSSSGSSTSSGSSSSSASSSSASTDSSRSQSRSPRRRHPTSKPPTIKSKAADSQTQQKPSLTGHSGGDTSGRARQSNDKSRPTA
ncbi:unnamed protein product [Protopolystoma xenopodis]|uniref:Uncharacterized protein n=1 Tax=Protopolystoma xenopodis TaxID=117903 RepID=A0A3S5CN59_9PLAT|nr:unnamed protein product [Protopolystoma xenopodis]